MRTELTAAHGPALFSGPDRPAQLLVLDRKLWRALKRKALCPRCAQSPSWLRPLALQRQNSTEQRASVPHSSAGWASEIRAPAGSHAVGACLWVHRRRLLAVSSCGRGRGLWASFTRTLIPSYLRPDPLKPSPWGWASVCELGETVPVPVLPAGRLIHPIPMALVSRHCSISSKVQGQSLADLVSGGAGDTPDVTVRGTFPTPWAVSCELATCSPNATRAGDRTDISVQQGDRRTTGPSVGSDPPSPESPHGARKQRGSYSENVAKLHVCVVATGSGSSATSFSMLLPRCSW